MVSWLAKTTQLLQRRPPPEPPGPFEVSCSCGHQVSGMRQPTYQSVTCHRCGNVVFVLPTDVYPKPKPKKVAAKPAPSPLLPDPAHRIKAAQPIPLPAATTKGPQKAEPTASVGPRGNTPAPAARREVQPADSVVVAVRRPLVSRFRLIVLAIGGVVAATGYFVWQSRLNDRALITLPGHVEAGAAALRAGELPKAADEYRQAAWAVNRLGREDAESLAIRQKAKELGTIVDLSVVSLFDICEETHRSAKGDPTKWTDRFNELYRDAWIVVEGDIIQDSGPDGAALPMLRFPFPIDAAPVVFDARLTALLALSGKSGPQHVIFAGQLASLAKEGTKNPLWIIRLKDETAFLWSGVDTYQAMGLPADVPGDVSDARHILNQQSAALGLKP